MNQDINQKQQKIAGLELEKSNLEKIIARLENDIEFLKERRQE